ncbi:OsmC family peroxiredoxin [bacterium]|nr:OsmC family peroxiredoxin [bacterium]
MSTRTASAQWKGTLKEGKGNLEVGSNAFKVPYTFASRFETGTETNPEELVGAAHSACFSMFVSALLSEKKLTPELIHTTASVTLSRDEVGPKITAIHLESQVKVAGISQADFDEVMQKAKKNCPISRLYEGTPITLTATLV